MSVMAAHPLRCHVDIHGATHFGQWHSDPNLLPSQLTAQAAIVECVSSVWWHWLIAKLIAGVGIGSVQATLPVVSHQQPTVKLD